jgi:probable phosphoglycerate mutase
VTLLALLACRPPTAAGSASDPVSADPRDPDEITVFVVRHAEKAGESADPELTEEGVARAALLAHLLHDVELASVHSTDTNRTRETARPTAEDQELDIELYDATTEVVDEVTHRRGAHLVVGHSNTVPSIVRQLDPSAEVPTIGAEEYDRLYIIVWTEADATTSLLRYGDE